MRFVISCAEHSRGPSDNATDGPFQVRVLGRYAAAAGAAKIEMAAILLLTLLALMLFGVGIYGPPPLVDSRIVAVAWLLGFALRAGGGRRWYYW